MEKAPPAKLGISRTHQIPQPFESMMTLAGVDGRCRDQDFRAALKLLGQWKIEEEWKTLLDRITDDIEKVKELNSAMEDAVGKYTYKQIHEKFASYSVKAAGSKWRGGGLPVTTKMLTPDEVLMEEHWQTRGTFPKVAHPSFGVITLPTTGKMTKTPLRVKWISANIGEDNDYVFNKYGLVKKGAD